jgi:hypothetical protein
VVSGRFFCLHWAVRFSLDGKTLATGRIVTLRDVVGVLEQRARKEK